MDVVSQFYTANGFYMDNIVNLKMDNGYSNIEKHNHKNSVGRTATLNSDDLNLWTLQH